MSTFAAIESAIRSRLAAAWTTTPIFYANTSGPKLESSFIYLDVRFVGSEQESIGTGAENRKYRHRGFIMIGIYTPKNVGSGLSAQYADTLAAIFRGQTFGGVVCLAPVADGGRPADDEGNYWLKTLTCEFYSDSIY